MSNLERVPHKGMRSLVLLAGGMGVSERESNAATFPA